MTHIEASTSTNPQLEKALIRRHGRVLEPHRLGGAYVTPSIARGAGVAEPLVKPLGYGLSARDHRILAAVGTLGRATSNHIYELCFTTSRPTLCSVLDRLVTHRYLRRSDRRFGDAAGSPGQYVYALGRAGWNTLHPDAEFQRIAVLNDRTLHTLAVGDVYLDVWRLRRDGLFTVHDLVTEPWCHRHYGDVQLRPDLVLDAELS